MGKNAAKEMKGADILLECLKKEGVDVIFGYPGGAVLEIYDSLYKSNIKHILVRHEQGAAHMADGYARVTGRVGVCLATSGPGATNLVTGIATAHMDSVPVVAITGNVGTHMLGTDAFQEADIVGITLPITKHNYLVKNVNDLAYTIKEAFHIARSGRPGPVLVDIAKDVTQKFAHFYYPEHLPASKTYHIPSQIDSALIKAAAQMIRAAKKPVILAGHGVVLSEAEHALRKFVNTTGIPVVCTLLGQGVYPSEGPYSLHMSGMHGTAYANLAINQSDLLIAIGMRFDDRITGKISSFATGAKKIHVDIDPAEHNKVVKVDLPIPGNALDFLNQINGVLKSKMKIGEWHTHIAALKKKHPLGIPPHKQYVTPEQIIHEMNVQTQGRAVISTDVGEHQMWAAQYLKQLNPKKWLSSGGLGTMGYGFPAAIGAWFGAKKEHVICISGDGSFQMCLQELGTCMAYNIPVKVFIFNNNFLGMVRQWQEIFYEKRYSQVEWGKKPLDFVKLAEAYGAMGLRVTRPNEVASVIKKALAHKGPVVVDFVIRPEESVYPMVPAGGAIDKMLFGDQFKDEI